MSHEVQNSFLCRVSCVIVSCSLCLLSCAPPIQAANQVCYEDTCYTVELADTQEKQSRGLMFREYLPESEGMLFVFPYLHRHSFWMKNTKIPLDIIWMDQSQRIVDIQPEAQPCQKEPCMSFVPVHQALYVLELNAGEARKSGLKIGDRLEFRLRVRDP